MQKVLWPLLCCYTEAEKCAIPLASFNGIQIEAYLATKNINAYLLQLIGHKRRTTIFTQSLAKFGWVKDLFLPILLAS